jgi:hypothetical protein
MTAQSERSPDDDSHMPAMRILPVVLLCRSLRPIAENQKRPYSPLIPARHEGRYGQSSRNVRRGAVDVWTAHDERRSHAYGEIAWSRCPDAGIKSWVMIQDDGGYQARHSGRHSGESAYKP